MPWCPKCKNEYREGFTVCTDCGTPLVSTYEEADETLFATGSPENMQDLKKFLEIANIHCEIRENRGDNASDLYDLVIRSKDEQKAVQALRVLASQAALKAREKAPGQAVVSGESTAQSNSAESGESDAIELPKASVYTEQAAIAGMSSDDKPADSEETEDRDGDAPAYIPNTAGVYHTKTDKAKDFRSSAWVMLIVGIAGLILVGLIQFGVVDIDLGNLTMLKIVTSIMFVIFIIIGIKSFGSAKKYDREAVEEQELTDTLCKWCDENLTAEQIDAGIDTDRVSEEMLYFPRTAKMKMMISRVYLNVNPTLLDHIVEQYYKKIYEGEE